MMSRSIVLEEREKLRSQIKEIANKYGAECVNDSGYAPWEPNFDSQLLAFARDIYIDHFGKEPKLEVTQWRIGNSSNWKHLSWYGYDFHRS